MPGIEPLVRVEGLHKSYGGVIKVLQGLNIEMKAGDRVVVIGPSGGGKSTLLRVLMGLEQIDSGSVVFGGKPYISADGNGKTSIDPKVRRSIGIVFQHYTLFQHLNIIGNLILAPMKVRGEKKIEAEARALALLTRFADPAPGAAAGLAEKLGVDAAYTDIAALLDLQPVSADIFEAMGDIGRPNDDVSRRAARPLIADCELGLAFAHHPGFGIGVNMQIRAATRIGIDEKDGYGASVFASFITHRPALAGVRFLMTADGKHLVSSLRQNYLREKIYSRSGQSRIWFSKC